PVTPWSWCLTGVMAPGADVIIWCQGQRRDVRFFLHKAGDLNLQQQMDPTGAGAVFRIPSVGRQHGGSYSCSYRPQSEPFVSSQPSDTVQLVVAEPTLPKPSISPSREVSVGGSVSIQCLGLRPGVRFVLNKGGRHAAHVDTDKSQFVFPINNVQWEQGGNYSCSHHSRSEPFTEWSDPVELVVRGEGPGSASPFPAPSPARPSRGSQSESGLSVLAPPGLIQPHLQVRAQLSVPAPHPAGPSGDLGTWLCPRPSRGDAWLGSGNRLTGGFPAGIRSSCWRFGTGGISQKQSRNSCSGETPRIPGQLK
uniref:Immunoglobulin domain-containing protein n=1 Tax=Chelonoidis abingdonii TaxID=106734 RepID=A0A8C0H7Q5_CHEAB